MYVWIGIDCFGVEIVVEIGFWVEFVGWKILVVFVIYYDGLVIGD